MESLLRLSYIACLMCKYDENDFVLNCDELKTKNINRGCQFAK